MPQKIESLYYGDKRLDTLADAITDMIFDRVGGQDVPLVAVIGVLEQIKLNLLLAYEED
jgi:hypothetical protein